MTPRILIACIGNIFLGDDGFGTEVARRLSNRTLPPGVLLKDFGIRSIDLTYALLEPYELVILVDASARGGDPGTIYLIEPDEADSGPGGPARLETHNMNPVNVLRMARSMGGVHGRVLIVGCEPADFGPSGDGGRLGLSEPVERALDGAVTLIESLLIESLLHDGFSAIALETPR
jgi:hydrogenase maturation protease